MANYCEYKTLVRGRKNACYAFLGSSPTADDIHVIEGSGTTENYTLIFSTGCKWGVDAYCDKPWDGSFPVDLPDDYNEASSIAEKKYRYRSMRDRSKMFSLEVLCNSLYEDVGEEFVHYLNGNSKDDTCPNILKFIVEKCDKDISKLLFVTNSTADNFLAYYINNKELAKLFLEHCNAECLKNWELTISWNNIVLRMDNINEFNFDCKYCFPKSYKELLTCLGTTITDDPCFGWDNSFASGWDKLLLSLLKQLHFSNENYYMITASTFEARIEFKDNSSGEGAIYTYNKEKNIDCLEGYLEE